MPVTTKIGSLKDLCNCPNPCSACCSIPGCIFCTDAVPRTLHATFSNEGVCSIFDGQSFELDYNDATLQWESAVRHCTEPVHGGDIAWKIILTCFSDPSLVVQFFNTGGVAPPAPDSCDPFQMTFPAYDISGSTCTGCSAGTYTVVLTA